MNEEIILPKGANIDMYDIALNEQYMFSVNDDLYRNRQMNKEDRATLYLAKKAVIREAPQILANAQVLSDFKDEEKRDERIRCTNSSTCEILTIASDVTLRRTTSTSYRAPSPIFSAIQSRSACK